jgi:GT2 family glycosyltransferase
MTARPILISIVSYRDERFLPKCLESVYGQGVPANIRIFDNAASEEVARVGKQFGAEVFRAHENQGFSRGQNHNLLPEDYDYALLLNSDVVLQPGCLAALIRVLEEVPSAGMAGGKMLRMDDDCLPVRRDNHAVLDSTGIYFTPAQRHLDRGSEEKDLGRYDRRQSVFGITGAAVLCRREMLQDVRFGQEYLDEDFFAYREDADLAWRAQILSWRAIYAPEAEALHKRVVHPSKRREVAAVLNYHSVKNRFLLRMKNMDAAVWRRCFPYMWLRDLSLVSYVALLERSSWPALSKVRSLRPRFAEKRRDLMARRKAAPEEIASWFAFHPVAKDLEEPANRLTG